MHGKEVFSYEPLPEKYKLLIKNAKKNNLENITLFNIGISEKRGSIRLYLSDNSGGHNVFSDGFGKSTVVRCISLKDVFDDNNIEHCDFLKVDCEGSEYGVLFNLPPDYFKKIEKMVVEYYDFPEILYNHKILATFLLNRGYEIKEKVLRDRRGIFYAKR